MSRWSLFEVVGVELEYMLVDATSLDVRPESDAVLRAVAGAPVSEVERGPLSWSNELVLHVLELKTNGPARKLDALLEPFQNDVSEINRILASRGARLMPTAMHPWMDPGHETRLWPHEFNAVYATFDRIFGCSGHGWSNLQSLHLNLPFADDEEFGRLHAAVRAVLPLLPALAASSPVVEGRVNGRLDRRLDAYRGNAGRVASVGGRVIPEPVYTEAEYRRVIFEPMMTQIAPLDPDGVLEEEFLNSRGAIARFSRGSIEIRLIDVQECPEADLAVAALVIGALRLLAEDRWVPQEEIRKLEVDPLAGVLQSAVADGERALVADPDYLAVLGLDRPTSAGAIWRHLASSAFAAGTTDATRWEPTIGRLLSRGSLARSLLERLGDRPSRSLLRETYRELCECLEEGRLWGVAN